MNGFLFIPPVFSSRLGSQVLPRLASAAHSRRSFLGQCALPDPQGSGGCKDVVACPHGPAVSNNPDGAAAPGQGRRYTIVDYKTGALIKADVGDEIWEQYSVTSLPDAWACEDPRCKPYCGIPEQEPSSGTTQPEGPKDEDAASLPITTPETTPQETVDPSKQIALPEAPPTSNNLTNVALAAGVVAALGIGLSLLK